MHADVDQCYNAFIDKISLLFDQACTIKNIEVKSPDLDNNLKRPTIS